MINLYSYGERNAHFHFKAKDTSNLFKCVTYLLAHSPCWNRILRRIKLRKSQVQESKTWSLPDNKLQSCGLMKGSICVWKDMGLWLCWAGANEETSQRPLADPTIEKPLRKHHLSSRPKRFFESFKSTVFLTKNYFILRIS